MTLLPASVPSDPRAGLPPDDPAAAAFPDDVFALAGPVGQNAANARADVIRAQLLLQAAGYLDLPDGIPTGWPGAGLTRAIRRYQTDNGLSPDGLLLPEDWNGDARNGETLRSLKDLHGGALAGRPVPAPADIDARHEDLARGRPAEGSADGGTDWRTTRPPPDRIATDAPPPVQPQPKPGQQEAFLPLLAIPAVEAAITYGVPLAIGAYGAYLASRRQPGRPASAKPDGADDGAPRSLLAPPDPAPAAPPSRPISDGDKAAAQTPPLIPPDIDTTLQGRPDDSAPGLPDEALIPPQIKDWYEGLEPFDQQLARELMIVMNRRGDDVTQLGNAEFTKRYLDVFTREFPHIRGQILHVAGSRNEKGKDLSEEHLPNIDTGGLLGGSWADITFEFRNHITETMYGPGDKGERNRVNTQTMQKRKAVEISKERRSLDNLKKNTPNQRASGFPKLRPDRPDGTVSKEALETYGKEAEDFARRDIAEWIKQLRAKGIVE